MRRPPKVDDDECDSCAGYGYFNEKTEQPTIDKRGRKCLDCAGTGTRLVKKDPASACTCGGDVWFVTNASGRRIFFTCSKCSAEWDAPIREIVSASTIEAWKRGVKALETGVAAVKGDEDCGLVQITTKDGCCVELKIRNVTAPVLHTFIGREMMDKADRKVGKKKAKKR